MALDPASVQACITAYNQAADALQARDRYRLPDPVQAAIATAILDLATRGILDPAQLKSAALNCARRHILSVVR